MEQYPIGCLLKMITDKIKIQADANLAQHDLTLTQSRVLGYLARNGGTATQKEIEGFLQVSHPTVAGDPPRPHIKCRRPLRPPSSRCSAR